MSKSEWQPYCDGPADAARLQPVAEVLCFFNRDEYHFVAEDNDELGDKIGEEIGAGQCDACGSFITNEAGEVECGPDFIVDSEPARQSGRVNVFMKCGCCGDRRQIVWRPETQVVF